MEANMDANMGANIAAPRLTTDLAGNFRPDLLFSYWIFAWFLLYYFIWPRRWLNPRLAFLAGTVENAIVFMMLFMYSVRWETILLYLAMMISIKIAPLWLLWNAPHPRTVATEVGLLCAVFAVYLFWLRVQNVNFITIYARTFDAIVSGTNQTPFFRLTTEVISSIRMVLSWLGFGTGGQQ